MGARITRDRELAGHRMSSTTHKASGKMIWYQSAKKARPKRVMSAICSRPKTTSCRTDPRHAKEKTMTKISRHGRKQKKIIKRSPQIANGRQDGGIHKSDFHHEAGLLEIRGTNSDAHPALVLPPALFHTALKSLQLRRKLEDDRRKRVTELEKFHNRVQQIDDENDMYVRQVDQIYAQFEAPDITAEEHAKLFECDQDCRKRAEENDAERALLVQREREICQEQGSECREENEALYPIFPLLQDVFEKAYILPEWAYRHDEPEVCVEGFESFESEPASAQALDANPNINDADRVDGTDPNHDLGLKEPIRKVNAQAAIANKADA